MAATVVPRIGRIHWDEQEQAYKCVCTGIEEQDGKNRVFKDVETVLDLAQALAFILSVFAPLGADNTVMTKATPGDIQGFSQATTAAYPAGYVSALT